MIEVISEILTEVDLIAIRKIDEDLDLEDLKMIVMGSPENLEMSEIQTELVVSRFSKIIFIAEGN